METILVVDDEQPIRELLGEILRGKGFECTLAADASEARALMEQNYFRIVISDINMPGESGLEFIQSVLSENQDTAGIMLTAVDDSFVAEKALQLGVYDYIIKPFQKNEVVISVANALRRLDLEIAHRKNRDNLEQEVAERTAELRKTLDETVKAIASALEWRDPYTAGHQQRVSDLACAIAEELGFSEERRNGIYLGGLVHDLGKISVPAEILSKPGRLSEMEFGLIKEHPSVGQLILKDISFPWPISEMVFQHHERLNGSGYPRGISGEEIIIEARILAVADVVEAMASHRPYRPAVGLTKALNEVSEKKGELYDPGVVDACLLLFKEKGFHL